MCARAPALARLSSTNTSMLAYYTSESKCKIKRFIATTLFGCVFGVVVIAIVPVRTNERTHHFNVFDSIFFFFCFFISIWMRAWCVCRNEWREKKKLDVAREQCPHAQLKIYFMLGPMPIAPNRMAVRMLYYAHFEFNRKWALPCDI